MSVYQVKEYYVFTTFSEDKLEDVKRFVNNCEDLIGKEIYWSLDSVTIEGFDCESSAEDVWNSLAGVLE